MKKTLQFLAKLKKNNDREWFEAHKEEYLGAKEEFETYVDELLTSIRKFDNKIDPDLTAKKCVFRIHKDVRFSKDKTPYKTNMGASMNPGGKKSLMAGYYFHVSPGECFIAGGVYMPDAENLAAIRQEIDYNPKEFKKILNSAGFKKYFKGLDPIDVLKTVPKGYDKENEMIEYLKHKHYIVTFEFNGKDLENKKTFSVLTEGFKAMYPFVEFLRNATNK